MVRVSGMTPSATPNASDQAQLARDRLRTRAYSANVVSAAAGTPKPNIRDIAMNAGAAATSSGASHATDPTVRPATSSQVTSRVTPAAASPTTAPAGVSSTPASTRTDAAAGTTGPNAPGHNTVLKPALGTSRVRRLGIVEGEGQIACLSSIFSG